MYLFFDYLSTRYLANLVLEHVNREMYPLVYLFVVTKRMQSQRYLKCLNVPNQFPFLHDQHFMDYEGMIIRIFQ